MSRRYPGNLFFAALCSSYVVLCALSFSANAADQENTGGNVAKTPDSSAPKAAPKPKVALEDSDSWRGKNVFERSRPEYTAEGKRVGGFTFKPSITVEEVYDSNIFATETSTKEDMITKVAPALVLESNWNNHVLKFNASGDVGAYSDNSRENYGDYTVGASGRLDVLKETYILGSASASRLHEDRGSPDARTNADSPTEYTQNDASLSFMRNLRRLSFNLTGDYSGLNYDNGQTSTGTVIINNDRDRDQYKGTVRVGYEIIPDYQAFVRSSINKRSYDLDVDQNGFDRDSKGYEVVGGTAINLGGKTKGEVFAGYMSQDYDSVSLEDASGAQFGGDILWNATGLTSVKIGILRGIEETTTASSSSYTATTYSVGLQHEVAYNVLAGIDASYSTNEYESTTATPREDELFGAGAELRYLLNRNASVVGRYDYTNRDSNVVNQDYDRSQVSLGLKLAM